MMRRNERWIERAADGELPGWTEATAERRAHMARVAALMDRWANALGLDDTERLRWRAAGWLHDVLRDAEPETLRHEAPGPFQALPGSFLHGPVTAARLQAEGLVDDEVLNAIRYHTLGDAELDRLGLALIAADYLEPGRRTRLRWRARLRAAFPAAPERVVRDVVRDKLRRTLEREHPIRSEMVAMYNRLVRHAESG